MLEPNQQETKVSPTVPPSAGNEDVGQTAEDLAIAKRMKQKSRNEAHLTAGCGYTTKKALLLNTFWGEMWPELEKIGWQKVRRLKQTDLIWIPRPMFVVLVCTVDYCLFFGTPRNIWCCVSWMGCVVSSGGRIAFSFVRMSGVVHFER
jgi:hypothetical protein